jgi:hypothetical protein
MGGGTPTCRASPILAVAFDNDVQPCVHFSFRAATLAAARFRVRLVVRGAAFWVCLTAFAAVRGALQYLGPYRLPVGRVSAFVLWFYWHLRPQPGGQLDLPRKACGRPVTSMLCAEFQGHRFLLKEYQCSRGIFNFKSLTIESMTFSINPGISSGGVSV